MELHTNGVHPPAAAALPSSSQPASLGLAPVLPTTLSQAAQQRLRALATDTSDQALDPTVARVLAQCADEAAQLREALEQLARTLATGDGDAARVQLATLLAPCHKLDACQADFAMALDAARSARTALDALLPDDTSAASVLPDPTFLRSLHAAARAMTAAFDDLGLNAQTWADQIDPAGAVPDA